MSENSDILVFNPLPWERELSGPIASHVVDVRGDGADQTSGRHFQDRERNDRDVETLAGVDESSIFNGQPILPPTPAPGYGYTTVSAGDLVREESWAFDERATVESDRYRITFDRERGGIRSWYDLGQDHEWVDSESEFPLAGFVHEQVADTDRDHPRDLLFRFPLDSSIADPERGFQPDWHAIRSGPDRVLRHRVYDTPLGYDVRQRLAVPQVESDVALRVLVPRTGETVVVEAAWVMDQTTTPQATYLAFPFDLKDPTTHIDVGGQAVEPGVDQLEGSVYDYYTLQRWAELSNGERGVTIGAPLNPMAQFGGFNFAANQSSFDLERALFLGWVTNNYWETNFRPSQPGLVRARYHLTPHGGPFDEARAHRLGMEAEHAEPLAQSTGEPGVDGPSLPGEGSLLELPDPPVLALQVRPETRDNGILHPGGGDESDAVLVTLKNASDQARQVAVESGAVSFTSARRVGLLGGSDEESIPVVDGTFTVSIAPRATVVVRLTN